MSKAESFQIKGWHVLAGLIAFFGVIIAVNVIFITQATRTFPGESVSHPYEKGIRYNETLEARAQTQKEGWKASISIAENNTVEVQIDNKEGPVDGLDVSVRLFWPGLPHADQNLKLLPSGPGQYRAKLQADMAQQRTMEFEGQAVRTRDDLVFPFKGRL